MNKRNRLESFSAREDDLEMDMDFAPPRQAAPTTKSRSGGAGLVLQIALGVWLGGLALALTLFGLSLVMPETLPEISLR